MKISRIALTVSTLLISGSALAHGYITQPPSRDYLCQQKMNTGCERAQWEPQSAGESPKGFPKPATPPDGQLVSGNGPSAPVAEKLNVQDSTRWYKNKIKAGPQIFTWYFTAPHRTTDFKYFITRQDWDANKPLTRESFELTPFCVIDAHGQVPALANTSIDHPCEVPERSGYQVIYASWEVDDTGNSFYKAIDVDFEETVPSIWKKQIGTITSQDPLLAGDSVEARFFDHTGERQELKLVMNIDSDEAGREEIWVKALAEKINSSHDDIRAGAKDAKGDVHPSNTRNTIYAKADSHFEQVEVIAHTSYVAPPKVDLGNITEAFYLSDGQASVKFDLNVSKDVTADIAVKNKAGRDVGFIRRDLKSGGNSLDVKVNNASAGKHTLVVIAEDKKSGKVTQQSADIELKEAFSGEVKYSYPDGAKEYREGTKVVQPEDNIVYECIVAGWCQNVHDAYKPGSGWAWDQAWKKIGPAKSK